MASLLLLLLLICTTPAALSARRCADCGSSPVPYPLSTGPDCGDQSYKIRCSSNNQTQQLFFDTLNNTYPIRSISPESQRLTIQPSPFLSNTSCITQDISNGGVLLNSSLPFNITSSNTIIFLNCSASLLSSPLNCSSESLCHTYVNESSENGGAIGACRNAPICCTFRAGGSSTSDKIRVRESGCRAYRSFVNLDSTLPVSRWPEPGMELQWVSPPEPVCMGQSDCDSDSTCRPDPNLNGGISRCFCHSGFHWDPIAALCAQGK